MTSLALRLLNHSFFLKLFGMLGIRAPQELDLASTGILASRAFLIRLLSAALAFVFQIALARWLGAEQYGIFIYVWTWLLMLGGVASIGFSSSCQRFISEYIQTKHDDLLRGFLLTSRLLPPTMAAILGLIAIGLLWLMKDSLDPRYIYPLALAAVCLPAFVLTDVQDGIARTYNAIETALVPGYILRPLLILFFVYTLGHVSSVCQQPCASTVMTAGVYATFLAVVIQYIVLKRTVFSKIPQGAHAYKIGIWTKASLPIFLMDGFYIFLTYADVIILTKFVSADQVAIYFAATKILAVLAFVGFSVAAASTHRFAEYYVKGDMLALHALVGKTVRLNFYPSFVAGVVLLALGWPLLKLFGEDFTNGYPMMFVIALGLIARASVGPVERMLVMAGQQNRCATIYALCLLINISLCIVLIPKLGAMGAAVAICAVMIFESAALYMQARRYLGIRPFIGHHWRVERSASIG